MSETEVKNKDVYTQEEADKRDKELVPLKEAEKTEVKALVKGATFQQVEYGLRFTNTRMLILELNRREEMANRTLGKIYDLVTKAKGDMLLEQKEAMFDEIIDIIKNRGK